jgi:hypothetical protein
MTTGVPRSSAIAFGVAALISLSTLPAAQADPTGESAHPPTTSAPATPALVSTAAEPSLNEPAPTPAWAESGPHKAAVAQNPSVRHYVRRHTADRSRHRDEGDSPVRTVAMGVAGGAADLGSVAAYPFYCFPNYGSCSVRVPYHY